MLTTIKDWMSDRVQNRAKIDVLSLKEIIPEKPYQTK